MADGAPPNLQESIKRYTIGPLQLDAARRVVTACGRPLPLGPRAVATLALLVERAGEVVTKDEILDRVWFGEDVSESNVPQSVYTLRKALREHGIDGAIVTVPRRGYRFVGPVAACVAALPAPALDAAPVRPPARGAASRFCTARWLIAALTLVMAVLSTGSAGRPTPSGAPLSPRGAERYRLARYYWNLRTQVGFSRSARLFADVVRSDPRSPLGYAGVADVELMRADYAPKHAGHAQYYLRARAAIRTALALDPGSAPARASLGILLGGANGDMRAAEAELRRAIALDPGYASAHHWLGTLLVEEGRLTEATGELRTAIALDPVATATGAWLAEASYYRGQYADAIAYERRALDLDPHRGGALRTLGLAYELAGDLPRAIATFRRMRAVPSEAVKAPALLSEAFARAGRRAEARAALRVARRARPNDCDTAFAMLALGDRRGGLAVLARARSDEHCEALRDPRSAPFRTALARYAAPRSS